MNTLGKFLVVSALCVFVASCEHFSDQEQQPSIGSGTDDYKESPCACVELKQRAKMQRVS